MTRKSFDEVDRAEDSAVATANAVALARKLKAAGVACSVNGEFLEIGDFAAFARWARAQPDEPARGAR